MISSRATLLCGKSLVNRYFEKVWETQSFTFKKVALDETLVADEKSEKETAGKTTTESQRKRKSEKHALVRCRTPSRQGVGLCVQHPLCTHGGTELVGGCFRVPCRRVEGE